MAAYRLGELIQAEKYMTERDKPDERAEHILQALDRAAERLGYEPVSESIRAEALGGDANLQAADRRLVEEIASQRYVLRNTFRLAEETQDGREYMRLAEVYGSGCVRLLKMLKAEGGRQRPAAGLPKRDGRSGNR
jgi:hypothetical protein